MTAIRSDTADLVARYEGRAPRYTSYPTAVQFGAHVTTSTYSEWIGALDPAASLGLYLHVPFCSRLCWFCGCNTRVVNRDDSITAYMDFVENELAVLERLLAGRPRVNALHLGGGTPNILSRDHLTKLFSDLRHVFALTPNCAIAAEMDPATLTESWVRAAAFHGMNRASLGVQDLSPHVQKAVNRILEFDRLSAAVGWLRDAGVESINFDLMYGLPQQTARDVLSTLDKVLTLRPDRLALFGYAHAPWMKSHQRLINEADLPAAMARLEQAELAAERLVAEGYVRIGMDHFALPTDDLALAAHDGSLHRNFQGYTSDPHATILGIGPSAIGSLPQGFVQNEPAEVKWRAALSEGRLPVARGLALTPDDRFRGEIIEQLMCNLRVDLGAVATAHRRDPSDLSDAVAQLAPMEADGLVVVDGDRIQVTAIGLPFVRLVCMAFDAYTAANEELRHARAV